MASTLRENHWSDFVLIIAGGALFGAAMGLFMVPYKVAPGGISGLAIIFSKITPVKATATWLLALEIPIFLTGVRVLGYGFGIKSLLSTASTAGFTYLFADVLKTTMPLAEHNLVLAPIFGALVQGLGLGLIIRAGGATSGSGTVARIIAAKSNLTVGQGIAIINSTIILLSGWTFQQWEVVMYGFIALYTSTQTIDLLVDGLDYARLVFVISRRSQDVADAVMTKTARGGTALKGRGLFSDRERELLFLVVTRQEVAKTVQVVKKVDPQAFVVVTDVHEVLGKGFRRRF